MTSRSRILIILTVVALVVAALGITAALSSDDDNEQPITGVELERATEAAITHMAITHMEGGTVTDTEVGDEESYYEVEVTLDDGTQVDVQLDRDFNVVGTEQDDPEEDDD